MKKIISIISGLSLVNTSTFFTVACINDNSTIYTTEYKSLPGFESSEASNVFYNQNNIPLIFIAFAASNNEQKFLIIENKKDSDIAIKVRNFYNIPFSKEGNYQEKIISDIKYSYIKKPLMINNQNIKADIVTKIDIIK